MQKQTRESGDVERILRDLCDQLAQARTLADVNIAAGVAVNTLDGVGDSDA